MDFPDILKPDYLFETSWEVCNKVGGIHTVIATKAKTLEEQFGDRYLLIGPDVWKGGDNPEFTEDVSLFKSWKEQAIREGLKVKTGRWKISGNPIVILIDFTSFFTDKNSILTEFWTSYQVDSLTGGWDYIEPALFGYAAGKVIECFYLHHLNNNDRIIAQFHEWMTGTGLLYLAENVPQAATVFTTHATVLGRSIAGSGGAFYSHFDSFVPEKAVAEYNVVAKNSLEKITANIADCFTTVSDITAKECVKFLGRKPDVITHNGFDVSILPDEQSFEKKRAEARERIFHVAEGLFNQQLPRDSVLIIKSGRYEFKNKGIDIFIDSLARLNSDDSLTRTIVGVIFVPAHQTGPLKDLLARMEHPDFNNPNTDEVITHCLQGAENDAIINEIKKVQLHNSVNDKVKIIFVPTYLDGNDGIFNMQYYQLLIGFDMAVFPSYYEPWGYTPLESIAYHIPSITTNVSGFGAMIEELSFNGRPGISVVKRTDFNETDVAAQIAKIIAAFTLKSADGVQEAKADAWNISLNFLWDKLIERYEAAYDIALRKSLQREHLFHNKPQVKPIKLLEVSVDTRPTWRSIIVEAAFPEKLAGLKKLSKNLWWCWNYEAEELFEYIDNALWAKCGHNPLLFTRRLSFSQVEALASDEVFLAILKAVEAKFDEYMSAPVIEHPQVAYFSMEYGLCSFIKLYSGGLGVLAGDHLKQASDDRLNITAIGLRYKNGYFKQRFSISGEQLAEPDVQDFANMPLQLVTDDKHAPLVINLFFPGRTVAVHVWKLMVGRIPLYLLDTDLAQNIQEDREITSSLYESNQEVRLKQEFLLGIGGIRVLNALGIKPDVYHCNEGHASFIHIERIYNLIKQESLSFDQAREVTGSTTLFTTHTSVPAANDMFSEELMRKYIAEKARFFNIDWARFMGLGRVNPGDDRELFSMTCFGAKMSQEINAVSKIHKGVSQHLFSPLWKNYLPAELHIGSVTNGVHFGTWVAKEWQQLLNTVSVKPPAVNNDYEAVARIHDVPAREMWEIHLALKRKLISALEVIADDKISLYNKNEHVFNNVNSISEGTLIIGFARRFVAYKRSGLLFTSMERLQNIIAAAGRQVVFIFSGKAHPRDTESIHLINQLVDASQNPALKKSVIFLEDYNMDIARMLVQGVDVWLNTPDRQLEASGTSGMKAAMNGVLNFSVMDGWWAEAYDGTNGWKLSEKPVYSDHAQQDQLDAEIIYNTLENEIIPLFFDRDENEVPVGWVEKMKASLTSIVPVFNMHRVVAEYTSKYYNTLCERGNRLTADKYALAKDITSWKNSILQHWNEVDVISIDLPDINKFKGHTGEKIKITVVLDISRLTADDIAVEIVVSGATLDDGFYTQEFSVIKMRENEVTYECLLGMERTGNFDFAFRIFAKNVNLPHRQDFSLVKWI